MTSLADRYIELRREGYDRRGATIELMLTDAAAQPLERAYRTTTRENPGSQAGAGYLNPAWRSKPPLSGEQEPVDVEAARSGDAKHVASVLALGGFPRASIDDRGRTEWLGPDNRRWGRKAKPRGRAA